MTATTPVFATVTGTPLCVQRSRVVDHLRSNGYEAEVGSIRLKLAREFGFSCGADVGVLDVMVVIGGANSVTTQALAAMCAPRVPTFQIDTADCVTADAIVLPNHLVTVGVTAGESIPDSIVGEVIERLLWIRGFDAADLLASHRT